MTKLWTILHNYVTYWRNMPSSGTIYMHFAINYINYEKKSKHPSDTLVCAVVDSLLCGCCDSGKMTTWLPGL